MAEFELTEEMLDAIFPATVAAAALGMLDAQLDALTEIQNDLRTSLATWPPVMQERASKDLRGSIAQIRRVLDSLEGALPPVDQNES